MITEKLPCDRDEALQLLYDTQLWLYKRAKISAIVGVVLIVISLILSLIGSPLLAILGLLSVVFLSGLTLWLYNGNKKLGDDVGLFLDNLRSGNIDVQDYCGLPIITVVVAYKLRRTGEIALEGEGRGKSSSIHTKGNKYSL